MVIAPVLEPPQVGENTDELTESLTADPAVIGRTTTSLGSYCLRWELILRSRVRSAPTAPVRNVLIGGAARVVE